MSMPHSTHERKKAFKVLAGNLEQMRPLLRLSCQLHDTGTYYKTDFKDLG